MKVETMPFMMPNVEQLALRGLPRSVQRLKGAGLGGWLAARAFADPAAALSGADRQAIETVVRDYILEHPEILPQAMEASTQVQRQGAGLGQR